MARKVKADCRADTRGGRWAGIPVCVIESAAYRDCSVHARAILVELVARMMGWNNGKIAVSHRELRDALRCSPRKITKGVVELWQHGFIDVEAEGKWKERQAREYRLTFVSTKGKAATNEYRDWTPGAFSGVTDAVAGKAQSATAVVTEDRGAATDAVTGSRSRSRKTANSQKPAATDAVTLICKPYPTPKNGGGWWLSDHLTRARAKLALAAAAMAAPQALAVAA